MRSTNTSNAPLSTTCQCGRTVPIPELITKGYEQTIDSQAKHIQSLTKIIEGLKADKKPKDRKTKLEKFAAITIYLQAKPNASSKEIGKAIGIDSSDVRRLWGPIKKAMKEGKSELASGYINDGTIYGVDETASCKYCQDPLRSSFECHQCDDIIIGECKTCHFTQTHPKLATP